MRNWLIVGALGLALTGCDDAKTKRGAANAQNVSVAVDSSTGNVAVHVPGFSGNIEVPKQMIASADFDIDGVKLYPSSKVDNVDVQAKSGAGVDNSTVRIGFTSPADVATVRDHFVRGFAAKGVAATSTANGLTGTNRKGDRFTLTLDPEGAAQTKGMVTIVDTKE